MGLRASLRALTVIAAVSAVGYLSVIATDSVDARPARVVDALIDTDALAATAQPKELRLAQPPAEQEMSLVRVRGEAALGSFAYDWRAGLPNWEISFHPGRSGVLGYTFVQEQRIEVYVRDEMSDQLLAHVIAHEIGHAIDVSNNSGDDRRRWQELREIEDAPWWPTSGATDFSTGAGDFAESFAAWQVGDASFRSRVADPPSAAENELMAELVSG